MLGAAIKYVKELEERLKWAEEEAADQKRVIESVVFAKENNRSSIDSDDKTSTSSDENGDGRYSIRRVPKIETRVLEKGCSGKNSLQETQGLFSKNIKPNREA